MMLEHMGETQAANILQQAVWELYAQKRIPMKQNGSVAGGAARVVKQLEEVLKRTADLH
jgi:isocitrate/isopropylmalate dehydrogenase